MILYQGTLTGDKFKFHNYSKEHDVRSFISKYSWCTRCIKRV